MAVKTWEEKYEIARSYYQEHGNLLVPDKHIYGGINLGNWIYLQRKAYKDGKLQENRISTPKRTYIFFIEINTIPNYQLSCWY